MKNQNRHLFRCAVEEIESRQLLSTVSVMPPQVSLQSVTHGHGVVTVAILGDANLDVSTINASSLTLTATPAGSTTPANLVLRGAPHAAGSSGTSELILKFTRSQLQQFATSLTGGTLAITIDAQGTTTANGTTSNQTDFGSGTLTLFQPGHQGHGHGNGQHHGHGHGHGGQNGQATLPGTGHGPGRHH